VIGKDPLARRLGTIPPYLFSRLDEMKSNARQGLIDLGEGNPDIPPAPKLLRALRQALLKKENHRYPTYAGKESLRLAITRWYWRRFRVKISLDSVIALIGSKEGLAHLIWGTCDSGDIVGVCDPGYPVALNQTRLCGATPITVPLEEKNNFLPDLDFLKRIAPRLKLLCLNFPNNPTGAVASLDFYQEVVQLALKYGFYIANDNVYSEIYFDSPPPSILQVPDADACAVEFHSLSKTFSIPGWRIGMVVGNKNLLSALLRIKQNTDSGPWGAVQDAAHFALQNGAQFAEKTRKIYQARRDAFCQELNLTGCLVTPPAATFYIWAKLPEWWQERVNGSASYGFVIALLEKCRVLAAPGLGFGRYGEGYVRFALIAEERRLAIAARRLKRWLNNARAGKL